MSEQSRMPVTVLAWKPMARGALLGFVNVRLGALEISDVKVMASDGRKWCGLPARPQIAPDGTVRKTVEGKIAYTRSFAWATKEAHDKFSISVIEALEAAHPGSTG